MVTWRDLEAYFDHVWSVHPIIGAAPGEARADDVGSPDFAPVNARHTFVSGKTRRFEALTRFPYFNFALAQVQLVAALNRLVKRETIGVVRGDPYYCGLLAHLVGYLNGLPVEVRVVANGDAGYEATGEIEHKRLFRWRSVEQRVTRFNFARADAVVVGSDDNMRFALANGARPETIAHTGNIAMVHPAHFQERSAREPLEDIFGFCDRPIVLCVSRLERVKHPEDVLLAVAQARRRNPEICGILVGDGTLMEELRRLREKLGLQHDFVLTGERDQLWIARLLPMCAVTAAPLAGLSLVEAALSETPIVAYDFEWHSEVIRSRVNGLLIPYRDTDAMAAAICELVEDPDLAARLGRTGRERVLEMMSPDKFLEQERAIARQLIEAKSIAPTR